MHFTSVRTNKMKLRNYLATAGLGLTLALGGCASSQCNSPRITDPVTCSIVDNLYSMADEKVSEAGQRQLEAMRNKNLEDFYQAGAEKLFFQLLQIDNSGEYRRSADAENKIASFGRRLTSPQKVEQSFETGEFYFEGFGRKGVCQVRDKLEKIAKGHGTSLRAMTEYTTGQGIGSVLGMTQLCGDKRFPQYQ